MITSGHRYWSQADTNWMTASAPMVFQLMGIRMRLRKISGPAPSMRAASDRLAGMFMKCWRNSSTPVADARNGTMMAA